jgi:hypothetical protein
MADMGPGLRRDDENREVLPVSNVRFVPLVYSVSLVSPLSTYTSRGFERNVLP